MAERASHSKRNAKLALSSPDRQQSQSLSYWTPAQGSTCAIEARSSPRVRFSIPSSYSKARKLQRGNAERKICKWWARLINLSSVNVNQRSLETAGLELCGGVGTTGPTTSTGATVTATAGVPQGQPSSAGSIGSAPSPASPRPAAPQHRPPLTTSTQSSRNLDDDRSTDVGPNTAADDSDDSESRAQYVSANCVVFTHYRGDAASEVEEHFQRALAQDKPKDNNNPMITRNFPASFWKSHHEVYEYTDPWHSHYTQYHPRTVHEYHHHHNMAAASYNSLLLNRSLAGHPSSHPGVPHHAHTAATYKDWTSAAPSQSLVDASSAPPYPHGPYASLSSDYWT